MTTKDEENYQNSNDCWICNEKIIKDKVRDHCHIKGNYRVPAQGQCNLKLKTSRKLPIIFHNLESYDSHLIFRKLNIFKDIDIQVIPKSSENIWVLLFIETLYF